MRRLLCLLPLLLGAAAVPTRADRGPNLIYVMIDDAGYGDLGGDVVKTPAYDRMCREGTEYLHHYSGSSVCAPTRCVLMTGLDTGHCRRRDNTATGALDTFKGRPLVFLEKGDPTVARTLKEAGYVTGGIGKWGLGNPGTDGEPGKQGFDHFYGYLDQVHAHDQYTDWLWRDGAEEKIPGNAGKKKGTYIHDLFEKETLDFIRRYRDKPFFLYLPYTLPHGAYEIPQDAPELKPYADKGWSKTVKNYAAMITRVDGTVGKMLDLLKELGLDEQTVVFYTSDNGPNTPFLKPLGSGGGLRGIKRQLYEGGTRAKMVARWPGRIPAGKKSDFVWTMVDVYPTLCALAGTRAPKGLQGRSVMDALLGKEQDPTPFYYWEIHHPFQQAVRMGNWKGIRFGTAEPLELYDLAKDAAESHDVSAANADVVKQIERIMATERTDSKFYPVVEKRKGKRKKSK